MDTKVTCLRVKGHRLTSQYTVDPFIRCFTEHRGVSWAGFMPNVSVF